MVEIEQIKEFVKQRHGKQQRKGGAPYYLHPYAVAEKLKIKGFDTRYQIAGLFHDLLEDTDTQYHELVTYSNEEIAHVVKLLSKEKGYIMAEYISGIENNEIAKMVKLADRVHNLEEACCTDLKFKHKYIKETEQYYVELAHNTPFEIELNKALENLKQSAQFVS